MLGSDERNDGKSFKWRFMVMLITQVRKNKAGEELEEGKKRKAGSPFLFPKSLY